jgi:hypothetical protein
MEGKSLVGGGLGFRRDEEIADLFYGDEDESDSLLKPPEPQA